MSLFSTLALCLARGRVLSTGDEESPPQALPLTCHQVDKALTYVFRCPWSHAVTIGMRSVGEVEEDVSIEHRVDSELSLWRTNPAWRSDAFIKRCT